MSNFGACRSLFEEIDTDRSGGIDAQELAAGLKARGYAVTEAEVEQLLDRMDLNQDGSIAFDEFSSALVDWKKVGPIERPHCVGACPQM